MVQEYRNIYQIARESTGLTQETSSELIEISVDSLRAYEGEKRIPPDKVVIKMIEIYDVPYLYYQHMKTKTQIGEKFLPEVQIKKLAEAVLTFLDKYEDLEKVRKLMIKIACDGEIDSSEKADWKQIMNEINEIVTTGIALKFAK